MRIIANTVKCNFANFCAKRHTAPEEVLRISYLLTVTGSAFPWRVTQTDGANGSHMATFVNPACADASLVAF